jgi:hypothetical protein
LAYALCRSRQAIRDSRGEVSRLIDTFRIAAEDRCASPAKSNRLTSARNRGYQHVEADADRPVLVYLTI